MQVIIGNRCASAFLCAAELLRRMIDMANPVVTQGGSDLGATAAHTETAGHER